MLHLIASKRRYYAENPDVNMLSNENTVSNHNKTNAILKYIFFKSIVFHFCLPVFVSSSFFSPPHSPNNSLSMQFFILKRSVFQYISLWYYTQRPCFSLILIMMYFFILRTASSSSPVTLFVASYPNPFFLYQSLYCNILIYIAFTN